MSRSVPQPPAGTDSLGIRRTDKGRIDGVETADGRWTRNLSDCRLSLDGLSNVLPGSGAMAMINAMKASVMNHSEPLTSLIARSAAFARASVQRIPPRFLPSCSPFAPAGSPRLAFPHRIGAPAECAPEIFRTLEGRSPERFSPPRVRRLQPFTAHPPRHPAQKSAKRVIQLPPATHME